MRYLYLLIIVISFVGCKKQSVEDFGIIEGKFNGTDGGASGNGNGSGSLKLVCGGSNLPSGFHCLTNSGGATAPHSYQEKLHLGNWHSSDYDICISYNSDGTGVVRYGPSGFGGGGTTVVNIKWGILVNSDGSRVNATANHYYITHEGIEDPQVEMLTYRISNGAIGENFGFVKQSCPF
jgi:hypothetical protein